LNSGKLVLFASFFTDDGEMFAGEVYQSFMMENPSLSQLCPMHPLLPPLKTLLNQRMLLPGNAAIYLLLIIFGRRTGVSLTEMGYQRDLLALAKAHWL
jgi:hypothetical protein